MIKIRVKRKSGKIVEIIASGHSGYAERGKDIICAAVSAVVQTGFLGVNNINSKQVKINRDDEDGFISLKILKFSEKDMEKAQIILDTMILGLKDIELDNKKYLKLEEEDEIY